jgi:hypothetical protein
LDHIVDNPRAQVNLRGNFHSDTGSMPFAAMALAIMYRAATARERTFMEAALDIRRSQKKFVIGQWSSVILKDGH